MRARIPEASNNIKTNSNRPFSLTTHAKPHSQVDSLLTHKLDPQVSRTSLPPSDPCARKLKRAFAPVFSVHRVAPLKSRRHCLCFVGQGNARRHRFNCLRHDVFRELINWAHTHSRLSEVRWNTKPQKRRS